MDINKVIMEYDSMFGRNSLPEIDTFLNNKIDEAQEEGDFYSMLSLLNEHMGFCRDTSQTRVGIVRCEQVLELLNKLGLKGTLEYATSLINVANAYRAFGEHEKSLELFMEVEKIYSEKLPQGEYNYASLYNNWSLLYQEMGYFDDAARMLKRAMGVVDRYPGAVIQQAITRSNLASSLLRLCQSYTDEESVNRVYDEAVAYVREALKIFEDDGGKDFHYSGALAAMADALYMKNDFSGALPYYEHALSEIEKNMGNTSDSYIRVKRNMDEALRRLTEKNESMGKDIEVDDTDILQLDVTSENENMTAEAAKLYPNNIERSRAFYEAYGADMLHNSFAAYEDRIAVGICGEGSDCFGFDDRISMDHDYECGFCMWLTDEDYDEIGADLEKAYNDLLEEHGGEFLVEGEITAGPKIKLQLSGRRGVMKIYAFYEELLGICIDRAAGKAEGVPLFDDEKWCLISAEKLAAAVNGEVFRDKLGCFTAIRNKLCGYYPRRIWLTKLAEQLHYFSQYAQSNYPRMMARGDYATAAICVAKGMESAMDIAYTLNRRYAPYYKWKRRGLDGLNTLSQIGYIIDNIAVAGVMSSAWDNVTYDASAVNEFDEICVAFDDIATYILDELNTLSLVKGNDVFLEKYVMDIMKEALRDVNQPVDNDTIIDEIVKLEWEQFDKVKNEGGRASCQDNWNTFSIMRRSQYMAWNRELLVSYREDLLTANKKGWNMITEKYARMMESTVPDRYEELKKELPVRSEERIAIQEEIIKLQVEWMEQFAEEYPMMAGNARSIHTNEDTPYNTSYETYLRGELGTYSEDTFILYGRFVIGIKKAGGNLAYAIMDNTAKLYGYKGVADAESRMSGV